MRRRKKYNQIAKNTIQCHISHLKIKPENIIKEIRTSQNTETSHTSTHTGNEIRKREI